jgi:N-acyl-D-amino-acid deacylase
VGTFPRVLGHYSREVGLFPLETAVWKMTGLTAGNFGLADQGAVAVGKQADLVLFDAGTVKDAATYEEPTRPAEGIHTVIVDGGVAWEGGRSTGVRRGKVLRRTPAATATTGAAA